MTQEELEKYSNQLVDIVGDKNIFYTAISSNIICDYFKKTGIIYRQFHSKDGAMHFPVKISEQTSHNENLLYHAETIHKIINENNYSTILEIGCGMGFNTHYLSKRNENREFTGIDLEINNIHYAKQKSTNNNVSFYQLDYHNIERLEGNYDLIFAVETLCYSNNLFELLNRLSKKLKNKGKLIIFDGYIKSSSAQISELEKHALKLVTWGWSMPDFQKIDDYYKPNILTDDISIMDITELSEKITPNVISYQKGAIKALQYPFLIKVLFKIGIIPLPYIKQISAGIFAAHFIQTGHLGYYKLELSKSNLPITGTESAEEKQD